MSGFMADFDADLARPFGVAATGSAYNPVFQQFSTSGAFTFTAPTTGLYIFFGTGGGGTANSGTSNAQAADGAGGASGRVRKLLLGGQTVQLMVGAGGGSGSGTPGNSGANTTFTFPDGTAMVCGGGGGATTTGSAGGIATGADAAAAGNPGGLGYPTTGGGGAGQLPGYTPPSVVGKGSTNTGSSSFPAGGVGFAVVTGG